MENRRASFVCCRRLAHVSHSSSRPLPFLAENMVQARYDTTPRSQKDAEARHIEDAESKGSQRRKAEAEMMAMRKAQACFYGVSRLGSSALGCSLHCSGRKKMPRR